MLCAHHCASWVGQFQLRLAKGMVEASRSLQIQGHPDPPSVVEDSDSEGSDIDPNPLECKHRHVGFEHFLDWMQLPCAHEEEAGCKIGLHCRHLLDCHTLQCVVFCEGGHSHGRDAHLARLQRTKLGVQLHLAKSILGTPGQAAHRGANVSALRIHARFLSRPGLAHLGYREQGWVELQMMCPPKVQQALHGLRKS